VVLAILGVYVLGVAVYHGLTLARVRRFTELRRELTGP
jgi:hypothetical protein